MSTVHEIVRAVQNGEPSGWNILYGKYFPGLYAVALRHSRNASIAKETVQDAFITAYLKLHQLKDPAAFGGWIKTILIRACHKEQLRNQKNKTITITSTEIENISDDPLNRHLESMSMRSNLYTSIANLPEILRSTLLLRYFSEFQSYEDIASILKIPLGTVRSRLNQARLKLTDHWQHSSDFDSKVVEESESWNHFYDSTLAGMHHHDHSKNRFINHLRSDIQIVTPEGKSIRDSGYFERMIHDDRNAGSWLLPLHIMTSGNISIVEIKHFNSAEHPGHCPAGSVMVIYRCDNKISKLQLQVLKS